MQRVRKCVIFRCCGGADRSLSPENGEQGVDPGLFCTRRADNNRLLV